MDEHLDKNSKPDFHYDREERLKGLSDSIKNRERKGPFKGNRSLIILLLDIILLVVVGFIIYPLINFMTVDKRIIEDWKYEIKAFYFEDKVYANLIIERKKIEYENISDILNVRFLINDSLLDEKYINLPEKKGDIMKIGTILDTNEIEHTLELIILFNESEYTLTTKIKT